MRLRTLKLNECIYTSTWHERRRHVEPKKAFPAERSIVSHSTGVVYISCTTSSTQPCALAFRGGLESCGIAMDGWTVMGFLFWNDDGTKWDLIVIVVIWRTNCRICPSRNHVIDVSPMSVVISERHRHTLTDHWGNKSSVCDVAQTT